MEKEQGNSENGKSEQSSTSGLTRINLNIDHPRPVFLSVICLFSFVFYGLISLIFLLALFYSGWISEVRSKYLPEGNESKAVLLLIITSGFLLHLISLAGSIKMWKMRKSGYLMFSVATLIAALLQIFSERKFFLVTALYISLIVLFGLYYRRFH